MVKMKRVQAWGVGGPTLRFGGLRADLVVSFFRIVFMCLFFSFGIGLSLLKSSRRQTSVREDGFWESSTQSPRAPVFDTMKRSTKK